MNEQSASRSEQVIDPLPPEVKECIDVYGRYYAEHHKLGMSVRDDMKYVASVAIRSQETRMELLEREAGFARLAYDQLQQRMGQEIERAVSGATAKLQADLAAAVSERRTLPKPDGVSLVGKKSIQLSYFGDVTPEQAKAAFDAWLDER